MGWSSDGRYLSFTRNVLGTDLWILPGDRSKPYQFLQTAVSEAHSQINPGAPRWTAACGDRIFACTANILVWSRANRPADVDRSGDRVCAGCDASLLGAGQGRATVVDPVKALRHE